MKTKGIYFLYRVLQAFVLPALLLYFLVRSCGDRKYWRSLPQRFGFLPHSFRQIGPGAIWLHAVSMGEVLACVEFARRLKTEFPRSSLFLSTATLAGHATAEQKLTSIADGIFFAPVDYVWVVRRVLRTLKPALVIIAETEIWPNLLREVHRTGAGLAIVNARISDKALPKYLRLRWIFPVVLAAVDRVLAQTEEIAERFRMLGAERVLVGGNLKFDFEARAAGTDSPVVQMLQRVNPRKVWIAASTMADDVIDEDDAVIGAWQSLARRDVFLILVPRKPKRFEVVSEKLQAAGIRYARRSRLDADGPKPDVLLLDSIGELGSLFAYADVVFMGGTLTARGGHNILEPALFGKPVIVGPHMENFQAIADEFRAARAMAEIGTADELAGAVDRALAAGGEMGQRARICAEARRGATAFAIEQMREIQRIPRYRPPMPWFLVARALSEAWKWEAKRRQVRDYAHRKRLKSPVISIGNLTMGGTGKTPCVLRLTELLRERGHRPGILTRGYGRTSPVDHMALAAGANVRPEESGDEPQIFLRSRVAPVGIGADRFQTGSLLAERFGTDVVVLDDGFQHVKLARNFDLVLIDALKPFGGGEIFPAGRLREPVQGIARADAIIITRSDASDLRPAIETVVRRWNARIPIFRARIQPEWWVEHRTGKRHEADKFHIERPGVFCGLGNPVGFYRTLESLGLRHIDCVEFEDHHRYRSKELERIAGQFRRRGAATVVTTEKDAINLCEGADDMLAPLPLYWLKVGMRIEGEEELLALIEKSMAPRA
uniref:Tetraacyldisaccharide 4'-kinase n=1 Tax=Solibacter usitatus (strain Ellin6076) TaxID=234267 RepID=Q01SE9_SOLUE